MRKGIVMEIDDPYLTLLTQDGEFLRARKMDRNYSVGEEIDFFPVTDHIVSKKSKSIRNFFNLRTALMTAAVLIICLGSIIPVYQSNKAYAYMSIDASTSIEMGLNKEMEVVELKGFDKEADEIISQLEDWEKKDVSELTAIIVAELKDEGQLSQSEPVVISTVKTKQLKDKVETKLQENVEEIQQTIDDKQLVKVNVYTTTEEEIEKARNSGVPFGIYQRNKNKSAKNKQPKEKNNYVAPIDSAVNSKLPPGQQKKQNNISELPDNKQKENLNRKQNNEASPGLNLDRDEKLNNSQVEQRENNGNNREKQNWNNNNNHKKQNGDNKQEKQKTNNHHNSRKHENNGKK
jgi:hypothetical protein